MKLISFINNDDNKVRTGIICKNNSVCDITDEYGSMNTLIQSGRSLEPMKYIVSTECELKMSDIKILSPIPNPLQDIICLGINYMEHAKESARFKNEEFDGKREYPVYFSKRVNEALPDGQTLKHNFDTDSSLDYEAELACIIGTDAENVSPEDAEKYIFGYTIMNDVSSRNIQNKHKQWYFGKSLNGFAPMGPCIITEDEISFPPELSIKSYVNDELRQNSNTGNMIFGIPYIISELSHGIKLNAGTIISTGTPSGVGMGFTPPKFLKSGDKVVCEIDRLGTLTTYIR